jgi:hypothetical protein
MATSTYKEQGEAWKEDFFFPATGWWYVLHEHSVERTVGYTTEAAAISAAAAVTIARGVKASWSRDNPGLYSVTVETDTKGPLTIYDPQPT